MQSSIPLPSLFTRPRSLVFGLVLAIFAGLGAANAQTTAINYTGALHLDGAPFTGTAEIQFTLWDALAGGNEVAASSPATVILGITNGVFATPIDFGASAFTGANRWLQIQVRTNIAPFSTLSPRQPIASVPYAIRAAFASAAELPSGSYSNAVVFSNPANLFTGNGSALTGLNAASLASGTVADARLGANVARTNQVWLLGGNTGNNPTNHFIGTTDQKPVEFRVNNQRVFRFDAGGDSIDPDALPDGAPNIIGGSRVNFVTNGVTGATISGGGAVNFNGQAYSNRVSGDFGTVAGGAGNHAAYHFSTVGGGWENRASGWSSTVAGGNDNIASSNDCVVAGGRGNIAGGGSSTIGGGINNLASGGGSAVLGGYENRALDHASVVGGGEDNVSSGEQSTVAGGAWNDATGVRSAIGGGSENEASGGSSAIAGGFRNEASGQFAAIGGGSGNIASGQNSAIPGGAGNEATETFTLAAGARAKAIHRGSFVWADGEGGGVLTDFASTGADQFCIRARGGVRLNDLTSLYFGESTRQMINLFDNNYGIGVQNSTLYFRSNDRFSWYRYGAHNDTENAPGTGGSVLMTLTSGGLTVNGAFVNASDRDKKENFQSVNPEEVLARVIALPLSRWSYRDDEERSRHLGPMAQDFHAAFGLGADNKHIATVDADGVALAAIQGLNAKVDQAAAAETARVRALEATNATLERRLAELERLVSRITAP